MLLVELKIDSDENTAALMKSILSSNCSESTQPQKVVRNDSEHASDGHSRRGQRAGIGCNATEQPWARLLDAVRMLVFLAPVCRGAASLGAACARAVACIPPGSSHAL